MVTRCPTCSKPFDGESVAERILAHLVDLDGMPASPRMLARALDVRSTTIYQTLNRLKERGAIKREYTSHLASHGWVLVPQTKPVTRDNPLGPLRDAAVTLVSTAESRGWIDQPTAFEILRRDPLLTDVAEQDLGQVLLAILAEGSLVRSDGGFVVPGE